jgi:ligand-binding sensor domain-containing protein
MKINFIIIFYLLSQCIFSQNNLWISFEINDNILSLCEVNESIWVGQSSGVSVYDYNEINFYDFNLLSLPGNIFDIALDDKENIWLASYYGGLIQYNQNNWILFDSTNSDIPKISLNSIVSDSEGNIWIGTDEGLLKYDKSNWYLYTTSNSELPSNQIFALELQNNILWIGTQNGLAKFDGSSWSVYNTNNSGLPYNFVYSIAFENNFVWIGTAVGGLAKYDNNNNNWTVFNKSNSGLPHNKVKSITVDSKGRKWIGTWGGLAMFDNLNWTVFNDTNSPLDNKTIETVLIDSYDNVWIGSNSITLYCYNENGIVSVDNKIKPFLNKYLLSQNYPNPFNPTTMIDYTIPNVETLHATSQMQNVTLKVFDILGREVATLVNEQKKSGNYQVQFDASNLSSGLYLYKIQAGSFSQVRKMIFLK